MVLVWNVLCVYQKKGEFEKTQTNSKEKNKCFFFSFIRPHH